MCYVNSEQKRQQELKEQENGDANGVEHSNGDVTNGPAPATSTTSHTAAQIAAFAATASSAAANLFRRPSVLFANRHANKLKLGLVDDDVHVCIMCMRAIMNNKYVW